jgi:hypothetical protein
MRSVSFDRFGGNCAVLLGIGGLVYAILFAFVLDPDSPTWVTGLWLLFLMIGGFLTTVVAVALYQRLRETDEGVALWALLLGLAAAIGGIVHAGFQLLSLTNPVTVITATGERTPADPVGVLRFGMSGITLLIVAWLIVRGGQLPRALGILGYIGGALLVFIYVGRLFDFITPADKVTLIPPFLYGFIVHPLLYVWLGRLLLRTAGSEAAAVAGPPARG